MTQLQLEVLPLLQDASSMNLTHFALTFLFRHQTFCAYRIASHPHHESMNHKINDNQSWVRVVQISLKPTWMKPCLRWQLSSQSREVPILKLTHIYLSIYIGDIGCDRARRELERCAKLPLEPPLRFFDPPAVIHLLLYKELSGQLKLVASGVSSRFSILGRDDCLQISRPIASIVAVAVVVLVITCCCDWEFCCSASSLMNYLSTPQAICLFLLHYLLFICNYWERSQKKRKEEEKNKDSFSFSSFFFFFSWLFVC